MKRKGRYLVLVGLFLLTLGGCSFTEGSYADEESEETQDLFDELNSVPEEDYRDWVEEKIQNGELFELGGEGGAHVYGDSDWSVVTEDDLDPEVLENLKALGWF